MLENISQIVADFVGKECEVTFASDAEKHFRMNGIAVLVTLQLAQRVASSDVGPVDREKTLLHSGKEVAVDRETVFFSQRRRVCCPASQPLLNSCM